MRTLLAIFLLLSATAQAQIGWTLTQCRKHFGHELWMEDDGPAFGIKYRYHTREENLAHDYPAFYFDGILLTVTFDPDGTVGKIWWRKSGLFSDSEVKKLLKSSSAVTWRALQTSPRDFRDDPYTPRSWVGEQNGVILFDAKLEFFLGSHDNLTVTTR